jgi:Ras family protein A
MYRSAELEVETVQDQAIGRHGVELVLWDTGGDFSYASFRAQYYPDSHLGMICFAIDNPNSLESAEDAV